MENYSVYEDIANRTGGDVYLGVVGPVRTGKSTFIKRFMELLVLPFSEENARKEMTDELPQSASGKTVMTTEPKFVPAKAAEICISKSAKVSVRLVDCVGFGVDGANGYEEDGSPRLVKTPWQETPMPFEKAAELGTQKVIQEHSTIGVLVTTDGSITDIPRSAYVPAEERAVAELKAINKPFVIILNCQHPHTQTALKNALQEKYGVSVLALNVETMGEGEVLEVLQTALFEFPVTGVEVHMPPWLQTFPETHWAVASLLSKLKKLAPTLCKMRDCLALETLFEEEDDFLNPSEIKMELGKGVAEITIGVKDGVYHRLIGEICGESIENDLQLMQFVRSLAVAKQGYEKVKDALGEAEKNGYGIVYPTGDEYALETPKLIKKSAGYGVQFRANATSYHIVRVDITGAVSPVIGTKEQGEDFARDTKEAYETGDGIWETNIFGKSLHSLVSDELSTKSNAMPPEIRKKLRRAVTKIVNEGKTNVFCWVF